MKLYSHQKCGSYNRLLTQTVFISVNFFLASYKQEMRVFFAEKSQMKINRAENFRKGDIEINA